MSPVLIAILTLALIALALVLAIVLVLSPRKDDARAERARIESKGWPADESEEQ